MTKINSIMPVFDAFASGLFSPDIILSENDLETAVYLKDFKIKDMGVEYAFDTDDICLKITKTQDDLRISLIKNSVTQQEGNKIELLFARGEDDKLIYVSGRAMTDYKGFGINDSDQLATALANIYVSVRARADEAWLAKYSEFFTQDNKANEFVAMMHPTFRHDKTTGDFSVSPPRLASDAVCQRSCVGCAMAIGAPA
jgi:hypothetical protein